MVSSGKTMYFYIQDKLIRNKIQNIRNKIQNIRNKIHKIRNEIRLREVKF